MATSIFFGGRRINIPQAVSRVDASALAGVSPAAVGIVALVGTAEGGKPLSVDSTYSDHTRPESALEMYRSGDLRIASQFAFSPSLDDAVPGGAQRLVNVKVNPATQGTLTLADVLAVDSVDLTSTDWGLFANQINITVEAGTNQGKKITIVFEDDTETFDDVGGNAVFDLLYTPGADGYSTALATLTSSLLTVAATKAETGLTTERTAEMSGSFTVTYTSSSGSDTTQTVTVYGLDGSGDPATETASLAGTGTVAGTQVFSSVLGAVKSAATVGTVTVVDSDAAATVFSLAPATLTRGVVQCTNCPAAGALTVSIDTDTAVNVAVFGTNASNAAVAEVFDMTAGATTPVAGSTAFANLSVIALGDVAAARTITVSLTVVSASLSLYTTVQRLVDYLNALDGLTATALATNSATYDPALLDAVSGQTIVGSAYDFLGDLKAFTDKITDESNYLDAARASGATAPPAVTGGALYLTGGSEGTTTATEWTAAFNLLKQRRVNIIVPLSRDPAIHALLAAHLVQRAGKLRSEANGYIGIATAAGAGETKSNIKSQIQALSTRHLSAISEECKRAHPDTLVDTWFPPYMYAAIAAGMQAGSAIGEPLTKKRPFVLDIRRDSSWTVEDDGEEMVDAGLMFSQNKDGEGISWVRSITTHLADDNVVFSEMSANEAANTAVYELRRTLEQKIGQRGLAGTAASLKALAAEQLNRLVKDEIIVAWRSLAVEQVGDVFPTSVEIAPVLPINFIPITVHLVAVRQSA